MRQYLILAGAGSTILVTGVLLWYSRPLLPAIAIVALAVIALVVVLALVRLFLHVVNSSVRVLHVSEHGAVVASVGRVRVHAFTGPQVRVVESRDTDPAQLALPAPVVDAALPIAPAFSQIAHLIVPGHLFLGQAASGPIWGDIADLLSTVGAGRPNTGKSTLLRCVCAQVLRINGLPIVLDPHGSILDDLGASFQCAETTQEIDQCSTWVLDTLKNRLAIRKRQPVFQPLLFLVDELPVISVMSKTALDAIKWVVLEGRKVAMYAFIMGQGVPADLLGGALVRDAMSSRYVFLTTPLQARMAGIENEAAKRMLAQLEGAGPGKAILSTWRRGKPEIVAIPHTTTEDIRLLVSGARKPVDLGSYREGAGEVSGSQTEGLSPDVLKQALRMVGKRVKNGESPDEIRRTLGVDGGRAHQEINAALQFVEEAE